MKTQNSSSERDKSPATSDLSVGFTPGPWAIAKGLLDDHDIMIVSAHVDDAVVASIGMDMPEAEANARLIAAAPILFEAMKASIDFLFALYGNDELVDKLRAALALAKHSTYQRHRG